MFDSNHYVPVLRWKAAEREALQQMQSDKRRSITPLIELIMPQPKSQGKSLAEQLDESVALFQESQPKIVEDLLTAWGQDPVFIDLHLIDGSIRASSLNGILTAGKAKDIFMIPVVNIVPVVDFDSDANTREVAIAFAKTNKHGVCLRLSRADLGRDSLAESINGFVRTSGLPKEQIDLIVDLQLCVEAPTQVIEQIGKIPDLGAWRTFTVVGGSFPPDLTQFNQGPNLYRIPREDWNSWLQIKEVLSRKPAFGDYTVQHPIYRDPVKGSNPSASIRYATPTEWVIARGMGLRSPKSNGHAQYPAQAQILTQTPEYQSFGENFSFGDQYIARIGRDVNNPETGNPRTWLRAAINHHMSCVANQLSSLPPARSGR